MKSIISTTSRLGDQLVEKGLITQEQLELALVEQKKEGEPLGKTIQRLGYVDEDAILSILAYQAGVEIANLNDHIVEQDALALIPDSFARDHSVIPLCRKNRCLTVAITDPFDIMTIEEIERLTNLRIDIKAATESNILKAIDRFYGTKKESRGGPLVESRREEISDQREKEDIDTTVPVVELIDRMIMRAIKDGATDIHMEPKENDLQCRFRIDGILYKNPSFPKDLQPSITTRLKIMANLDISENRLPQDGKISFLFEERKVDLRVSTMVGVYGENIVLRVLDKGSMLIGLDQLGFSLSNLVVFKDSIAKSHGIILVTGPTGSGKTTTLYSTLSYINSMERNIMTLEDPVEYELPEICQSQINLKAGLTFAKGLRSILRQDPDVILVGEMRDAETVEVAIRAAVTGHLVFSTLHTNDAVGAINRLRDMGVEPYFLASSIVAIIAQRLVRRICPYCKEKTIQKENLPETFKKYLNDKNMDFYQGKGCNRCNGTGYTRRVAIFEILPIDSTLASLITNGADAQTLKNKAQENGMITMVEDGFQKVSEGITTIEELMRVAYA